MDGKLLEEDNHLNCLLRLNFFLLTEVYDGERIIGRVTNEIGKTVYHTKVNYEVFGEDRTDENV